MIDEYDKPLLDIFENEQLVEYNRSVFKGFFSTLKSFDAYLQFLFITGVTKFNKVSIFSDLNQLNDITFTTTETETVIRLLFRMMRSDMAFLRI